MIRACGMFGISAICLALMLPLTVIAGDEDREPAYKIYIDPETGKYTTEDPEATTASATSIIGREKMEQASSELLLPIIGAAAVIALIAGGLLTYQRKLAR